jgi:hypothetical protein
MDDQYLKETIYRFVYNQSNKNKKIHDSDMH